MAVLSKEDFGKRIKEIIGEDSSDSSLRFIEDMTDTYNDLDSKSNDSTDWKTKYETNDKEWRDRYKARFFEPTGGKVSEPSDPQGDNGGSEKPLTYENLFKEEK